MIHADFVPGLGVHVPYNWTYADETAREAATGFVAEDDGKLARQLDDDSIWMLTTPLTPVWVAVGSPATPDAEDVPYDNGVSGLTATDVQAAIDELAAAAATPDAADVAYDNAVSGLVATDVQAAIDELKAEVDGVSGGSGTKTLCVWHARRDSDPPASNYATFDHRNSRSLMDFDDTTDESLLLYGIIPEGADLSSGIRRITRWKATTATSGNIQDAGAFERGNTDSDSDSFATAVNSAATATSGTSGITTVITTDHSSSQIDGITAGDDFYLKITRLASGSDTVTGDLELVSVEIQQIA